MKTYDEARPPAGRQAATCPRWAICRRQFDLVRASDNVTYLTRWWIVATPLGGIALHRMAGPDARATLHDHPWHFLSVVLRGGYVERRLDPRTMLVDENHRVRWINRVRPWDAHAIHTLLRSVVWTFIGRKRRTWGFLEELGSFDGQFGWTRHDLFDSGHYVPDATWTEVAS